jgi:hypothetical protein
VVPPVPIHSLRKDGSSANEIETAKADVVCPIEALTRAVRDKGRDS